MKVTPVLGVIHTPKGVLEVGQYADLPDGQDLVNRGLAKPWVDTHAAERALQAEAQRKADAEAAAKRTAEEGEVKRKATAEAAAKAAADAEAKRIADEAAAANSSKGAKK